MTALKLKFNFTPNYGLFDKLCERPDFQLNDNGKERKINNLNKIKQSRRILLADFILVTTKN
jgi:hypothetical protein